MDVSNENVLSNSVPNSIGAVPIFIFLNDFPDTDETSDHRPVRARFNLSQSGTATKQDILNKIEELERNVEELKSVVENLP